MNEIVAEARRWIGTPYVHQASQRGAGCDCLGLIRGVWRCLYGQEPRAIPAYTPDWDEHDSRDLLMSAAREHLQELQAEPLALGHVVLFRMREGAVAKHLGIVAKIGDAPTFIHAYSRHGVIESPLSRPWEQRIAARFAFKEG